MKKKTSIFTDLENPDCFIASGQKNKAEVLKDLFGDYPETVGNYTEDSIKHAIMYKCLDCESYWISDDVCGDCGEYRLSKRAIPCWYVIG
jgi:hypothetical protein